MSSAQISFHQHRRQAVKLLPGFQKHHRVPTSDNPADQRFVETLVEPLIDEDLQTTFTSLRDCYGLKRKELTVDGPFAGGGVIDTPFFRYQVNVGLDPDDPSQVHWNHIIDDVRELARVIAAPFEQVFRNRFSSLELRTAEDLDLEAIVDAIEDANIESVKVDYDKNLSWCSIRIADSSASVLVRPERIEVQAIGETTPRYLLESLAQIQSRFIDSLNLDAFAFSNNGD